MDPVVVLTFRSALTALLVVAAVHKLTDLRRFGATLAGYRLLPEAFVTPGALLVPAGELGTAFLLWTSPAGGVAAALLFSLYAVAIAINLARGRRHIDCGCSVGSPGRAIRWSLVGRNAGLTVAALLTLAPATNRPLVWMDGFTITAATATLALLYVACDHMIALGPLLRRPGELS